jgi:DNA-binding Lrp family transcriptional regulator
MWRSIDLTSKIMREISSSPSQWNARRSYAEVARKLGVDEETVRNRLKMMREMGLLVGWRLVVNARLLAMEASNLVLEFDDPESKETAAARIRGADGVVLIQSFFGKTLQVTFFHPSDKGFEGTASNETLAFQTAGATVVTRWRVNLPRCDHKPKEIDWRIIGLMLRNAERRFPEIARDLKVSTRTVKRRVNLMMGSSAFFVQPELDFKKAVGVMPCQLLIQCAPEKKREIDDLIVSSFERIVFRLTNSETHSIFTILCSNVAEMKEILKWARSQRGVTLARTEITENQDYVHDWLEREVGRRTKNGPARGRPEVQKGQKTKPRKAVFVDAAIVARAG